MVLADPLTQACAALRHAQVEEQEIERIVVSARPLQELRAFRPGGAIGASPVLE